MTKALVLRTCAHDMTAHGGFQWPESGHVECPDWKANDECGNGLHGWLYGHGDYSCSSYLDDKAKWLVVDVELSEAIALVGKCKFPRGNVVFCGDRKGATDYLIANEPNARNFAVIGASLTVGDKESILTGALGTATAGEGGTATAGEGGTATAGALGTATAGDGGTATAGYRGTATAGYRGTATAGALGTATAGYRGTATAGALGTATAGEGGTATAGDYGTATAGYRGTATAGALGTATAGEGGTATAGALGTATAGYRGTATAGEGGEIRVQYYDRNAQRYRTKIGYIGEDGLLPNVAYRLDDSHNFIEVTK